MERDTGAGLGYRADIDGLRALAVAGVMLFHAGFDAFGGGFAGVDVFFAISGFLITSIIVRERERGTFSLTRFYERRARRILPALLVVLAASSIAALLLLDPRALREYANSVIAVLVFASNFLFMRQAGYFAPVAEELPLLHTWSLGVEEQFYIAFPLVLALLWRLGRRRVAWALAGIALASLIGAEAMRDAQPVVNFYLPFTRVWELLAGALLALAMARGVHPHRRLARASNEALAAAGVALIVASFVGYDSRTQFPGIATLPPVLGVLLVVAFGPGAPRVRALLSVRPLVLLGLVSYSAYLWHQPVFVFARIAAPHALTALDDGALIVLTLALAYASWRFVEVPARNARTLPRRPALAIGAAASVGLFAFAVAGRVSDGLPQRYDAAQLAIAAEVASGPTRRDCMASRHGFIAPEQACRDRPENVTWAVLGDSHVAEPGHALARRVEARGEGVLHLVFAACPPALLIEAEPFRCNEWQERAVSLLEREPGIRNVLLGFRDSTYLFGEHYGRYPALPDEAPALRGRLAPAAARDAYWHSYVALIDRLLAAGKRLYVLYPVPELPKPVRHYIFDADPHAVATPLNYHLRRHDFMLRRFGTLPWSERLVAIDPMPALCDPRGCRAVIDGSAMYYDYHHLSQAGAQRVLDMALGGGARSAGPDG